MDATPRADLVRLPELDSARPGAGSRGTFPSWAAPALVAALTFLAYAATLRFGFVYDDRVQIVANPGRGVLAAAVPGLAVRKSQHLRPRALGLAPYHHGFALPFGSVGVFPFWRVAEGSSPRWLRGLAFRPLAHDRGNGRLDLRGDRLTALHFSIRIGASLPSQSGGRIPFVV